MDCSANRPPAKKPHLVMIPYPAQGHINPLMQLAKQMVSHGFTITFVNTDHNHNRILAAAASSSSSSPSHDIHLAHITDGLPDACDRMADLGVLSEAIDRNMPAPFEALMLQLLHRSPNPNPNPNPNPPVCIVSDLFMLFTQDVADKLGIPRIAVWLQSAASFAVSLHTPRLIREGFIPISETSKKGPITSIPGHPPLDPSDLPSFFQRPPSGSNYMFQFKLRPFERLQEPAFILINTFEELEMSVVRALQEEECRVLPVGPLLPPALMLSEGSGEGIGSDSRTGSGLWPEDDGCLTWLDRQERSSVLYISFGSIASLSEHQLRELVLGLEASEQRILWAIRPNVIDVISPLLPPSFFLPRHEPDRSNRVYITAWAPQALVLAHRSVGGFLTHCGWNSTLESVSLGVPTLNWPYFADQMSNRTWMVDHWRIGMRFEAAADGFVTRKEVERLVRLLMEAEEGEEMRRRAQALSCLAKQALQKPRGSSHLNLLKVLEPYLLVPQ